jgi:hypothetical protein
MTGVPLFLGHGLQHLPLAVGAGGRAGLAHFCVAEQNTTRGVYARCWCLRAHLAAMTKLVWPWTAGSARVCSSDEGAAGDTAATTVNGDTSFFRGISGAALLAICCGAPWSVCLQSPLQLQYVCVRCAGVADAGRQMDVHQHWQAHIVVVQPVICNMLRSPRAITHSQVPSEDRIWTE